MGCGSWSGTGAERRRVCQHSGKDQTDGESPRPASLGIAGERAILKGTLARPRGTAHAGRCGQDITLSRLLACRLTRGLLAKAVRFPLRCSLPWLADLRNRHSETQADKLNLCSNIT